MHFLVPTMSKVRGWKIMFQKFMAITVQSFICSLVDYLPSVSFQGNWRNYVAKINCVACLFFSQLQLWIIFLYLVV